MLQEHDTEMPLTFYSRSLYLLQKHNKIIVENDNTHTHSHTKKTTNEFCAGKRHTNVKGIATLNIK